MPFEGKCEFRILRVSMCIYVNEKAMYLQFENRHKTSQENNYGTVYQLKSINIRLPLIEELKSNDNMQVLNKERNHTGLNMTNKEVFPAQYKYTIGNRGQVHQTLIKERSVRIQYQCNQGKRIIQIEQKSQGSKVQRKVFKQVQQIGKFSTTRKKSITRVQSELHKEV